jgi:hypothetical protein
MMGDGLLDLFQLSRNVHIFRNRCLSKSVRNRRRLPCPVSLKIGHCRDSTVVLSGNFKGRKVVYMLQRHTEYHRVLCGVVVHQGSVVSRFDSAQSNSGRPRAVMLECLSEGTESAMISLLGEFGSSQAPNAHRERTPASNAPLTAFGGRVGLSDSWMATMSCRSSAVPVVPTVSGRSRPHRPAPVRLRDTVLASASSSLAFFDWPSKTARRRVHEGPSRSQAQEELRIPHIRFQNRRRGLGSPVRYLLRTGTGELLHSPAGSNPDVAIPFNRTHQASEAGIHERVKTP